MKRLRMIATMNVNQCSVKDTSHVSYHDCRRIVAPEVIGHSFLVLENIQLVPDLFFRISADVTRERFLIPESRVFHL